MTCHPTKPPPPVTSRSGLPQASDDDPQPRGRLVSDYTFCPLCASPLERRPSGERERPVCPKCSFVQYRNPVAGVAVIVLREGRVLLGRRAGSYAGLWCIPCGYVEWDEDIRDAAVREMKEETGLEVEPGMVFEVHSNFHNPAQHTVGVWFMARSFSGEPRPGGDLEAVKFFPLESLPELAFPTDGLVLARLSRGFNP
jgi:8-oxo-dGTP diphosphatase